MPKNRRAPPGWKKPLPVDLERAGAMVSFVRSTLERYEQVLLFHAQHDLSDRQVAPDAAAMKMWPSTWMSSEASLHEALIGIDTLCRLFFGISFETHGWLFIAKCVEWAAQNLQGKEREALVADVLKHQPELQASDVTTELLIRERLWSDIVPLGLAQELQADPNPRGHEEVLRALLLAWLGIGRGPSKWALLRSLCIRLGKNPPPIKTMTKLWQRHQNISWQGPLEDSILDDSEAIAEQSASEREGLTFEEKVLLLERAGFGEAARRMRLPKGGHEHETKNADPGLSESPLDSASPSSGDALSPSPQGQKEPAR